MQRHCEMSRAQVTYNASRKIATLDSQTGKVIHFQPTEEPILHSKYMQQHFVPFSRGFAFKKRWKQAKLSQAQALHIAPTRLQM